MSNELPTRQEHKLLQYAYEFLKQQGTFPSNSWLARRFSYAKDSGVSNLKSGLKQKGYLRKEAGLEELTKKAYDYLKSQQRETDIVFPVEIRVLGSVEAGPRKLDELSVTLLNDPDNAQTITIPDSNTTSTVFSLQVNGQSMETEHIFDGDFIIVERFSNDEYPKQNELIVTMYLPPNVEPDEEWNDEWLDGPTVKYYFQTSDKDNLIHRLSSRKDTHTNPYTIKTKYIRPIGRVVGVYRPL